VSRPSGPRPRVAALIRRFPLTAFLVWFFTAAQAIVYIPVVAGFVYDSTSRPLIPHHRRLRRPDAARGHDHLG
jgi:hypothetical protein